MYCDGTMVEDGGIVEIIVFHDYYLHKISILINV